MPTDELEAANCGMTKEQKLMQVLEGLNVNYDNVFTTLIERMMNEKVAVDDAKALVLSLKCRLECINAFVMSPLPSVNLTVANDHNEA